MSIANTHLKVIIIINYCLFNVVVVLGNINVGKTSITERIMGKPFVQSQATVGVDFLEFNVSNIEPNIDLSIQLWDTCKYSDSNYL